MEIKFYFMQNIFFILSNSVIQNFVKLMLKKIIFVNENYHKFCCNEIFENLFLETIFSNFYIF